MCWDRSRPVDDLNSSRAACQIYDKAQNVQGAKDPDPVVMDQVKSFASQYLHWDETVKGGPWDPRDHRLSGARFYLQAALEVAISPTVGAFFVIEGVPYLTYRAAYFDLWNSTQVHRDPNIYGKAGMTFKF